MLDPEASSPMYDRLDDREPAAAQRLRDLLDRRKLEDPADRGDLVGDVAVHSSHACSTSDERSHGKKRTPA